MFEYGWKTQLSAFVQFLNYRLSFYFLEYFEGIASVVGQCVVKAEVVARAVQQGTSGVNGHDIATDRDPRGITN